MAGRDDHAQAARDLIARNLRRLRHDLGLSQEVLAVESRLMQSYLSGVEAGKRNPSLDAIGTIAGAMRVPVARLFEEAPASEGMAPAHGPVPTRGRR